MLKLFGWRHSLGVRLLVGFWLTLLSSAVCVWLIAQWANTELEIQRFSENDLRVMKATRQKLLRFEPHQLSIVKLLERAGTGRGAKVLLYDNELKSVVSNLKRIKKPIIRDIEQLTEQRTPIKLVRRVYQLTGPVPVSLYGKEYLLFIHRPPPPRDDQVQRIAVALVLLALLSVLFTVLFTRSIVRPIKRLRETSEKLAAGNWLARIDKQYIGKDEVGILSLNFNEMADKITQNWQNHQRLLADVSHELRSPLTRLNMAVALAEQAAQDNSVIREALLRIEQETERMDELIGKVLHLSRTEAAMTPREEITFNDLLEPVIDNARFEAQQSDKSFEVNTIVETPVYVQPEAIRSAVENVVRNALRYAKSKVSMQVSEQPTGDNNAWTICITDDGPGLDAIELSTIFTPFYRVQKGRDRLTGGVGLGLAIAKAAISAHDGTIAACNAKGGGLQVTITFPHHSS